ncbi:MAG: hypothetical protein IKJ59_02520 [Clostridia bacterium]|nr:hypothetical protein [Clostridia bacterium]
MQKRKNNIEEVEITYNGNTQQFQKFLQNVIREYISEDKISPDNPAATDQFSVEEKEENTELKYLDL